MVRLENLSIGYGKRVLFSSLSCEFGKGELICLLGMNGIGKSTLLRSISGLQQPLAGTVSVAGKAISGISHRSLSRLISIVVTEKVAVRLLTTREFVAMGRMPYCNWLGHVSKEDEKFVNSALEQTGTLHLAGKILLELSDGEIQKVSIARSIAQATPVIILDEPTSFLDIRNKQEIFRLLVKLAHEKCKTIITSTHESDLALTCADKILLLGSGNYQFLGTSAEIERQQLINRVFGLSSGKWESNLVE